jgi:hypothetical protein
MYTNYPKLEESWLKRKCFMFQSEKNETQNANEIKNPPPFKQVCPPSLTNYFKTKTIITKY